MNINKIICIVTCTWLGFTCVIFTWNFKNLKQDNLNLAFETSRAFFQQIILDRAWNSSHDGIYVPITSTTKPNPYLDDPLKVIETKQGLRLTKINPAFMTRQIAEIARQYNGVQFHLTSLKPIRPQNKPYKWEKNWLKSFEKGAKEHGNFFHKEKEVQFRYMAPVLTKKSCLKCHIKQGYKEGDVRGGLSITLPFFQKPDYPTLIIVYSLGGIAGAIVIISSGLLLKRNRKALENVNKSLKEEILYRKKVETKQEILINELQTALNEIKTLRGILPICSHCKQIRDDKGYWSKVETYITKRTEILFSHGICPSCMEKHYSDITKTK